MLASCALGNGTMANATMASVRFPDSCRPVATISISWFEFRGHCTLGLVRLEAETSAAASRPSTASSRAVMRVRSLASLSSIHAPSWAQLGAVSLYCLAALPDYMVVGKPGLVKVLPETSGPKYEAHFVYPQSLKNVARVAAFRDFIFSKIKQSDF